MIKKPYYLVYIPKIKTAKAFTLSYHNTETLLLSTDPYYENFKEIPEQEPSFGGMWSSQIPTTSSPARCPFWWTAEALVSAFWVQDYAFGGFRVSGYRLQVNYIRIEGYSGFHGLG